MKIAFAGTPEFAACALQALYASQASGEHEVVLVLTQPDRPAGRGMKLQMSPVKLAAQAHNTPAIQPRSLRLDGKFPDDAKAAQTALQAAAPDVMIVAAYGLMLPPWVLALPRHGCLNLHASLLPRWRGAAPIHRAIEAGDAQTGITVMQMDAGLDTGDMLLTQAISIHADDTTGSLHDKLATLGARLQLQALALLSQGELKRTPQPQEGITYAHKIDKAEAPLDLRMPAVQLAHKVRAFDPFPGASVTMKGELIKLWKCTPTSAAGAPGSVIKADASGVLIACGEGAILATELQRAGGKRLAAAAFLAGFALHAGDQFDLPT
jgi:methionyl-tRNA formyltransferase